MKQRLDEEQREQWVRHDGGVGVIVHMPLTIRYTSTAGTVSWTFWTSYTRNMTFLTL